MAKLRSIAERAFGILKQHTTASARRVTWALKRNQTKFMLAAMAYNIKRGMAVQVEMTALAG